MTVSQRSRFGRRRRFRVSFDVSVEPLEGRVLPAPFVVSSTADSGANTLRQAILNSNANPGSNTISFNITGSSKTIDLLSALPTIVVPLVLDGTTEPGYSGTPLIVLNGSGAGSSTSGLVISAGSTTVKGLIINQFGVDGIILNGNGDVIAGNYIGTDSTGTLALGNGLQGVDVSGADNTIGGSTARAGNVISGNDNDGLQIAGSGAIGNVVQGNKIGTNAAGTQAVGNGRLGILVNFAAVNNLIGTNGAGVNDSLERNIVSWQRGFRHPGRGPGDRQRRGRR